MRLVLPLLLSALAAAQSLTLTLSSATAAPGSSVTLTVSLNDSSPTAAIAGLQWAIAPAPGLTFGAPVLGAVALAASKSINCQPVTCVLSGLTNATLTTGQVFEVPIQVASNAQPGGQTVGLVGITGTNPAGTTGAGTTISITSSPVSLTISANPQIITILAGSSTDQFFSGGLPCPSDSCSSPSVLRFGPSFRYDIPLPNGLYGITAVLIEPNKTAPGQRFMTITANGQTTNNIDIFSVVGLNAPYMYSLQAFVGAGMLRLSFQSLNSNAVVSQIIVGPIGVPVQTIVSLQNR